ncbi:hypothetical protein PAXRUDRAFT_203941 [Paxillus rubicundulus Ve08.2h10]|uniref:Uncharacterized protein n=1 Tax=Paxillus rubicundulus Ve08.2h10 TaxID=930991 RepID=A0A0D0DHW2_9AGAM|nr:hypothetical protein PAXRUDRAFT_203941 [Paxillus rubicundulus Ve08.2h10]
MQSFFTRRGVRDTDDSLSPSGWRLTSQHYWKNYLNSWNVLLYPWIAESTFTTLGQFLRSCTVKDSNRRTFQVLLQRLFATCSPTK